MSHMYMWLRKLHLNAIFLISILLCINCASSMGIRSFAFPPNTAMRASLSAHKKYQAPFISSEAKVVRSIDEDLYSRQLLVLGKASQHSLQASHAAVLGDGPLAWEVAKNLALAGVGRLTVVGSEDHSHKLASYIRDLNPLVQVARCASLSALALETCTVAVLTDMPIQEAAETNKILRGAGVKTVFSNVYGVCGVVFADFMDSVQDLNPLGTQHQEVILDEALMVSRSASSLGKKAPITSEEETTGGALQVTCVDGEEISVQVADNVTLSYDNSSITLTVAEVLGRRTVVLEARTGAPSDWQSRAMFAEVIRSVGSTSRVVLTQMGARLQHCNHRSLGDIIGHAGAYAVTAGGGATGIIPSNACAESSESRLRDLLLLRLMQRADSVSPISAIAADDSFIAADVGPLLGKNRKILIDEARGLWHGILRSVQEAPITQKQMRRNSFRRCPATVSVLGAMAAQEAIKACTRTHAPLSQLYVHRSALSSDIAVRNSSPRLEERGDTCHPSINSAGTALYGSSVTKELEQLRVLVVGVGAIGCEVLKVLQQLNVGQATGVGRVTITDPDHIERSNLNRQLFFRERDVGQSKAAVAARFLQNSHCFNTTSLTLAVSLDTEHVFSPEFWKNIDVVITALDSTEARLYVDKQCVAHGIWMIDAGTTGLKGSTQVVIPFVSESYASLDNVPDKVIPVCTLKTFPYKAEHCIAWSKALFDRVFGSDITLLKQLLAQEEAVNSTESSILDSDMLKEEGVARRLLNNLLWPLYASPRRSKAVESVEDQQHQAVKGALLNALLLFHEVFCVEIEALVSEHPLDSLDEDDVEHKTQFWGKSRTYPRAIRFDKSSAVHKTFVLHAARIFCRSHGIKVPLKTVEKIYNTSVDELWRRIPVVDKVSGDMSTISLDSSGAAGASRTARARARTPQAYIAQVRGVIRQRRQQQQTQKTQQSSRINQEQFLKDSKDAGHVDFCTAATNLRSALYRIPPVDALRVQQLAGSIIPAMATTTALVAGLAGQELVKIAAEKARLRRIRSDEKATFSDITSSLPPLGQRRGFNHKLLSFGRSLKRLMAVPKGSSPPEHNHVKLERLRVLGRFRNSFVDLDGPVVAHAEPAAAEEVPIGTRAEQQPGGGRRSFTLWDAIQINENNTNTVTIKHLKDYLHEQFDVDLVSFVCDDTLLYANYLPQFANNKLDATTIHELVKCNSRLGPRQKFVELKVYCEDITNGFEVNIPKIIIHFQREEE